MTRAISTSDNVEKRKPELYMKTSKVKMKLISGKQRAEKRSHGNQSRKKKFQFSIRKIAVLAGLGRSTRVVGKKPRQHKSGLQVELMKTELRKMKVEISNSTESLMAAKIEANRTEAKLEVLITTRNELMDNLLEMKAIEAFLMEFL